MESLAVRFCYINRSNDNIQSYNHPIQGINAVQPNELVSKAQTTNFLDKTQGGSLQIRSPLGLSLVCQIMLSKVFIHLSEIFMLWWKNSWMTLWTQNLVKSLKNTLILILTKSSTLHGWPNIKMLWTNSMQMRISLVSSGQTRYLLTLIRVVKTSPTFLKT